MEKENALHIERHILLHHNLDELFADFIQHAKGRADNTIMDLLKWSCKQTEGVDHNDCL